MNSSVWKIGDSIFPSLILDLRPLDRDLGDEDS